MKFNILDLLLPREAKFYRYFEELAEIFIEACHIFRSLLVNIDTVEREIIIKELKRINECEHRGDELEHRIIEELNTSFITPLDREDVHSIAINLDRSLDILNSISRKVDIYQIHKVPPEVCAFAGLIVEISLELRPLFSGLKKHDSLNATVKRMHAFENKADDLFYSSVAALFDKNGNIVDLIRFKEFYEHMESVIDSVDYVGKIVRGIMIKQG